MPAASDRLQFAPPRTPGLIRALLLAVQAHGLLLAILSAGVAWKREAPPVAVQAELWSALPQLAAAPAPELPPPEVPPQPPPVAPPEAVAPPEPARPAVPDPAIVQEREKAREKALALKEKQLQQEKQAQEVRKRALAQKEKEKLQLQKERDAKAARAVEEAKAAAQERLVDELRQQNLKRMAGLAGSGGSGESTAANGPAQSSGPSASYAGRVRARIKPNITYIETIVGNPTTEIEVRTSPDGTIISSRITKPSGTKSWDTAALNAIEKTGALPRDENGRVPSSLIIVLSPQELIGR